jgi:integrase
VNCRSSGAAIESLSSLRALLDPQLVERVLDLRWKRDGDEPRNSTIDLIKRLVLIAKTSGCVDQDALARLEEMRVNLEQYRHGGLTEKNLKLIRHVMNDNIWREVVNLPNALMAQARLLKDQAQTKAAIAAQLAVAVAILTVAPIRISNLVAIRLDENLIKPGGPNSPYWLVFPYYDTKNRVDLNFQLDRWLTDLIDEYVHEFRPSLVRGFNGTSLFPGSSGLNKTSHWLGIQITKSIKKAVGLAITPHQFRHAAAAIYLKHHPGDYETVRRLLGHRNIRTTIEFYCGLETTQATELYGKIIREQLSFDPEDVISRRTSRKGNRNYARK